jgi:hypothetical protein
MPSTSHNLQSSSPLAMTLECEDASRQPFHAPVRRWTLDDLSDGQSSGTSTPFSEQDIDSLLPLSPVRTPDHSKVVIPRHTGKGPSIYGADNATPATLSARSLAGEPSATEAGTNPAIREKVTVRLVAGFFAYFCCGWTDGGERTFTDYAWVTNIPFDSFGHGLTM